VLKDRMYCDGADSPSRRSGQTAMYAILDGLVRMLAPILVHTAEELWAAMKFKSEDVESVHLASMPKVDESIDRRGPERRWQKIMALRDQVLQGTEIERQNRKIASNQEAKVLIYSDDDELISLIDDFGVEAFASLCIVSEVRLQNYPDEMRKDNEETKRITGVAVIPPLCVASKSQNRKCQRCWNYSPSVGQDSEYPDLCERCITVAAG
jgi:isoleucyl-tRNA synthetase